MYKLLISVGAGGGGIALVLLYRMGGPFHIMRVLFLQKYHISSSSLGPATQNLISSTTRNGIDPEHAGWGKREDGRTNTIVKGIWHPSSHCLCGMVGWLGTVLYCM